MPTSHATAVWERGLRQGSGTYRARSGAFTGSYSFPTRFEGTAGSTPEELIAAASASCFSMALSAGLEKAGTPPVRIETAAACTLDTVEGVPTVTTIALSVRGTVPGVDEAAFRRAADDAKDNCPVSRALKGNVRFTLDARLL